jgi:prepilin-type N-terminal cleavage/methylation domain-containing protein
MGKANLAGFTLIELLMTLTVIAILSAVAVSQFVNFSGDAKNAVTLERLNALKAAINGDPRLVSAGQYASAGYEAHCLAPPSTLTDLITEPTSGACAAVYDPYQKVGWRGPYVSGGSTTWNQDAWGTAFQYFVVGPPARTIRSCGPDLTCGTSDDISVTF